MALYGDALELNAGAGTFRTHLHQCGHTQSTGVDHLFMV